MPDPVPTPILLPPAPPTPNPWTSGLLGFLLPALSGAMLTGAVAVVLWWHTWPAPLPVPAVTLPATVECGADGTILHATVHRGSQVHWEAPAELGSWQTGVKDLAVWPRGPAGKYSVKAGVIDRGVLTWATATVNVTAGPAPPVPPVPPLPPQPPAPIPVAGLRVLIVYETADLSKMPAAQQQILYTQSLRDWLNAKCVLGADGKTREWRFWDQGVTVSGETKLWQDALARPRASVPWLVVSNGSTGFEGPLPATAADTLALLSKFGG